MLDPRDVVCTLDGGTGKRFRPSRQDCNPAIQSKLRFSMLLLAQLVRSSSTYSIFSLPTTSGLPAPAEMLAINDLGILEPQTSQ